MYAFLREKRRSVGERVLGAMIRWVERGVYWDGFIVRRCCTRERRGEKGMACRDKSLEPFPSTILNYLSSTDTHLKASKGEKSSGMNSIRLEPKEPAPLSFSIREWLREVVSLKKKRRILLSFIPIERKRPMHEEVWIGFSRLYLSLWLRPYFLFFHFHRRDSSMIHTSDFWVKPASGRKISVQWGSGIFLHKEHFSSLKIEIWSDNREKCDVYSTRTRR